MEPASSPLHRTSLQHGIDGLVGGRELKALEEGWPRVHMEPFPVNGMEIYEITTLLLHTGERNDILIQTKSNTLTLSALILMCVSSWGKYEALSKTNASHCSPALLFSFSHLQTVAGGLGFFACYMVTGLIKIIKLKNAQQE